MVLLPDPGLTLDTRLGAERITGELIQKAIPVARVAHADRALYTAKKNPAWPFRNVPSTILDPHTDNGRYTGLFLAGASPNHGVVHFPRGTGSATVNVTPGGAVRIVGKLADGPALSYGNAISKENEVPIFILLEKRSGLLSGTLRFDSTQEQTDASGEGLQWFKRTHPGDKLYPEGWPDGISLDLVASKFARLAGVPPLLNRAPCRDRRKR